MGRIPWRSEQARERHPGQLLTQITQRWRSLMLRLDRELFL
jgi:hypothetical protein